jgi:hypothetical protein
MPGNPYVQLGTSTALTGGRENSGTMVGGVDNYGEDILGLSAGGLGLGLQAAYPVAVNNAGRMADTYNQLANVAMDIGKAAGVYSDYKSGLGALESAETMGQTVAPGNLMNAGVDTALFLGNPIGAALWGLNKMTANEENPDGKLPLISDTQKMFSEAGDWLTNTDFGQEMVKIGTGFHHNVIKPITDTTIGETFMDLARLPLTAVEAVAGLASAGYEKLDSALFKGKLPGGAEKGKEVDFTDMVKARVADPLVANIEDLFGQDKGTELTGTGAEDMVIDPVPTTAETREATDNELLKAFGKDLESLSGGVLDIPSSQGDAALEFKTTFPDEHKLPDIETPVEQRILDALNPALPETPPITENSEPPSQGSAEWFAETPMEMVTVNLAYGSIATPHMVGADGTKMPIQRMPEFWDWLDEKQATLGDGGFKSFIASVYGVDTWTKTPLFRWQDWGNISYYGRKYNGSMDYASHIANWLPAVQTFYKEQVEAGAVVTPPATNEPTEEERVRLAQLAIGNQAVNISATINRQLTQQALINSISQPSWRMEQFSTPSPGPRTLPSIGVTGHRI